MRATPRHWNGLGPLAIALLPLAVVFRFVTEIRRALYRAGVLRVHTLPVPVVVVGNVTAGGTGKTPLVVWLAHALTESGYRPGVVTRGYGGNRTDIAEVGPGSDAAAFGDEAVLLARRSGCPVWRGADRVAAARRLLAAHPECDCILSDDGLQHYRLARDFEIVVVDGERGFGNGLPLPAGPLREAVSRVYDADAVVINGPALEHVPEGHLMRLTGDRFVNMSESHRIREARQFAGQRVHAVAGIGHPQRFFASLRSFGLDVEEHPFPDHHRFVRDDFGFAAGATVVMTEKDAVKCFAFAAPQWWYLPVGAEVDAALLTAVKRRLPPVSAEAAHRKPG